MKQWYRRTLAKVIVLLVGIISGAAFVTSLGVAALRMPARSIRHRLLIW